MAEKKMKKYVLSGTYTTVAEYAKANKITRKGAHLRLARLKADVVRVGMQVLVRLP